MTGDEMRAERRRPRAIQRREVPPGPAKDLADLLYGLYTHAEQPSLDEIAEVVQRLADELDLPGVPQRDTIARAIRGDRVPALPDVLAVGAVLAHVAGRDVAAVKEGIRQLWQQAKAAPLARQLGRPIREYTALALEVHPAIQAREPQGVSGRSTPARTPGPQWVSGSPR